MNVLRIQFLVRLLLPLLVGAGAVAAPPMVGTPPGQPPAFTIAPPSQTPPAPTLDKAAALRASQAAIGRSVAEHVLLDREGRPVRLSSYRGKPLLVSFIYTGCFQVCPTSTRALRDSIEPLAKVFGMGNFNVVSIGFNQPADSPTAMRDFAKQHGMNAPNWDFLSPPPGSVDALTRDFGFSYLATPSGFDHVLGVSVVDGEGRIYAQVYGERIGADQIGEPLRLLLRNAPMPEQLDLAGLIERVRLVCTVYDATTGKYRYDYGLILEIAGGVTFALCMLVFFGLELRNRWRARRAAAHAGVVRAATGAAR
jgi:protein SCO1/2